jgi:hypothetical protein
VLVHWERIVLVHWERIVLPENAEMCTHAPAVGLVVGIGANDGAMSLTHLGLAKTLLVAVQFGQILSCSCNFGILGAEID